MGANVDMSKTRAIRFSKTEETQIEEFLSKNSFFDFSSLARVAILGFIKKPTVSIQPIKTKQAPSDQNTYRSNENGHA
ncbi:MAG: hypothetical protein ABL927_14955 [Bdellovibrionales bacterium]